MQYYIIIFILKRYYNIMTSLSCHDIFFLKRYYTVILKDYYTILYYNFKALRT